MLAIDRLIEKIIKLKSPVVMGLDPRYDIIPECVRNKYSLDLEGVSKAILEFNKCLIDNTYDIIPAIKPQIAFYEMFGIPGMKIFLDTCKYAKEKGMIVIADNKRGDIGSTAKGYSNAYLGKTSNPSSGELQDEKLESGEEVYKKVISLIETWGEDLRGKYGYSSIGAVVGATYPKQLEELRNLAKHTFFLIPGYGAQGGKPEDIKLGFDDKGLGGIVNASRSLMCAYKNEEWKKIYSEEEYGLATRKEALQMNKELNFIKED